MKNWKKVSAFLLALAMSVSLAIGFAACGGGAGETSSQASNPTESSSIDSEASNKESKDSADSEASEDESKESVESGTSEEESSEPIDGDAPVIKTQEAYEEDGFSYPALQVAENYEMYAWTEFELVEEPTCETAGIKQTHWIDDESVVHQAHIAPRGHDYTNAVCACGDGPVYPQAPANVTYVDVEAANTNKGADGSEWKRFELTEGYFTASGASRGAKTYWLSFAVSEPGQYALYTTSGDASTCEIIRHDASSAYINPLNFPANNVDGVLYSSVLCSTKFWSESWRATYSISIPAKQEIKFRFVRIDDEPWEPQTVRVAWKAQQINGEKAGDGPENCTPTEVPFGTPYFYEESSGFYRMGTPDNKGDIIYVAITSIPERMLADKSFALIHYEGANLILDTGTTTVDGDYLVRDYTPFISADSAANGSADGNCYELYCNSDGLYPVNQELFEFLQLYTNKFMPYEWNTEDGAWHSEYYNENAWLAACFYYKNLTPGSKELPHKIDTIGDVDVEAKAFEFVYYSLQYQNEWLQSTITYCTITCDDPNAYIIIGDVTKNDPRPLKDGVLVETKQGVTFAISHIYGEAATFTLHITDTYAGSQDDPETLTVSKGAQTVAMNTIEHLNPDGEANHQKYYKFTVAENGALNFTSDVENVLVSITVISKEIGEDNQEYDVSKTIMLADWSPLEVKAGTVLEIVVGPTNSQLNFNMTIELT